jgi:hypothetical protein
VLSTSNQQSHFVVDYPSPNEDYITTDVSWAVLTIKLGKLSLSSSHDTSDDWHAALAIHGAVPHMWRNIILAQTWNSCQCVCGVCLCASVLPCPKFVTAALPVTGYRLSDWTGPAWEVYQLQQLMPRPMPSLTATETTQTLVRRRSLKSTLRRRTVGQGR